MAALRRGLGDVAADAASVCWPSEGGRRPAAAAYRFRDGNHLGYVDGALDGREFFIGDALTGADIQMSFVGEMAGIFERLGPYPNLSAWLARMHARPAFQRSVEKGGAYRFAK